MNKNTKGLVASILTGIQMALTVLLALGMVAIFKMPEFEETLLQTLNQQGLSLDALGFSYDTLVSAVIAVFAIGAVLSIVKFVFTLLGYMRNNEIFHLVGAICSIFFVLIIMWMGLIPIAIIELGICVLLFMCFNTVRKNKMMAIINNVSSISASQKTENSDDEDKTVIDIEL